MLFQIELFPCPATAEDDSRTRRPRWGELIMLSDETFKTREAALKFANLLWIGTTARIFLVSYDENISAPKTAWEVTRPYCGDIELLRGFPLRRMS